MKCPPCITVLALVTASAAVDAGPFLPQDEPTTEVRQTAQERCDALAEKAKEAQRDWIDDWREKFAAAEEAGEDPPALSPEDSPIKEFIPEFQAMAEEYASTDDAIPSLMWLFQQTSFLDLEAARQAIETLCDAHARSEALEPLARGLGMITRVCEPERATELLEQLEKQTPSAKLRGWAIYVRLVDQLEVHEVKSEDYVALRERLRKAVEEASDKRLKALLEKKIKICEAFGLGVVAPDIEGIDLDGVAFKLSDYKGKVLFVDFWGDW